VSERKVFSGALPPTVVPAPSRPKSGAEILLEACGFECGRFGWTSDEFPDVEISAADARDMDSRGLMLRLWRDGIVRGRQSLKAEIRLNLNAMLGTSI
jgi:hypothetical protein